MITKIVQFNNKSYRHLGWDNSNGDYCFVIINKNTRKFIQKNLNIKEGIITDFWTGEDSRYYLTPFRLELIY